MFNVFLDDMRPGPAHLNPDMSGEMTSPEWFNWVVCRSVGQVQVLLQKGMVNDLSLDHDLGPNMPTGYDLCKWMLENGLWPHGDITIHSQNPVGAKNMKELVDRHFYDKR
jgi:hypothetical protein